MKCHKTIIIENIENNRNRNIKNSKQSKKCKPVGQFLLLPASHTLLLQWLYKTRFPSSNKSSVCPFPLAGILQIVLLSLPWRIKFKPSFSKYRKSTMSSIVKEDHIARPPQATTKLPFFRKYSRYFLFLDSK